MDNTNNTQNDHTLTLQRGDKAALMSRRWSHVSVTKFPQQLHGVPASNLEGHYGSPQRGAAWPKTLSFAWSAEDSHGVWLSTSTGPRTFFFSYNIVGKPPPQPPPVCMIRIRRNREIFGEKLINIYFLESNEWQWYYCGEVNESYWWGISNYQLSPGGGS